MNRRPVSSSAVASIGYDAANLILEVELSNGRIYQYFDVPQSAHQALATAPSIGVAYNHDIKPHFRYAPVEDER